MRHVLLALAVVFAAAFPVAAQDHHAEPGTATQTLHDAAANAGHGAAAGGHANAGVMDFSWMQFASTLLAFGVVFFLLSKFAWPKIMKGLEDREQHIRSEVFAAEEARRQADASLRDYEKAVAEARAEASELIEKTKAEQTRMAAELRNKAEVELNQMRESARQSIEAAKRAALNDIYNEAASLATHVASKILQREVSEDDQKRLVEESVEGFAREYAAS